jgi:hypothetical protein
LAIAARVSIGSTAFADFCKPFLHIPKISWECLFLSPDFLCPSPHTKIAVLSPRSGLHSAGEFSPLTW